jgi:RsiW-degrading membrane proteinase PrsW (M82 family)
MDILTLIILSFIPALLYSFIIYATVPYKIIDFKKGLYYIFGGFLSVILLFSFFKLIPQWNNLSSNLFNINTESLKYIHFKCFIQIGFIEELFKLLSFLLMERYIVYHQKSNYHPLSVMFYVGMVSVGFSIIENVIYGLYSLYPTETIMLRSITAVIGHMVFGLFMGYWISLGRMNFKTDNRSLFDIMIMKTNKLKKFIFIILGLISATILHGLYDLHAIMNGNKGITTIYILLLISLLGVFWCFKHLVKIHKQKTKLINKFNLINNQN